MPIELYCLSCDIDMILIIGTFHHHHSPIFQRRKHKRNIISFLCESKLLYCSSMTIRRCHPNLIYLAIGNYSYGDTCIFIRKSACSPNITPGKIVSIEKIQEMKYITITNLLCKSSDRIALGGPSIYRIIGRSTDHRQISSLGGSASQKILISRLKVIVSYHSCFKSITHCQWCCREIFTGKHMVSHLKMRAAQGSNHCIGKQYSWSIHHLVT